MKPFHVVFFAVLLSLLLNACGEQNKSIPDQDFNAGWLFAKGDMPNAKQVDFDDSELRKLDLPHDWAV